MRQVDLSTSFSPWAVFRRQRPESINTLTLARVCTRGPMAAVHSMKSKTSSNHRVVPAGKGTRRCARPATDLPSAQASAINGLLILGRYIIAHTCPRGRTSYRLSFRQAPDRRPQRRWRCQARRWGHPAVTAGLRLLFWTRDFVRRIADGAQQLHFAEGVGSKRETCRSGTGTSVCLENIIPTARTFVIYLTSFRAGRVIAPLCNSLSTLCNCASIPGIARWLTGTVSRISQRVKNLLSSYHEEASKEV
ncbi:hypothetical protein PSPO01_01426 [Paraphaeosphaeria sporulosa]